MGINNATNITYLSPGYGRLVNKKAKINAMSVSGKMESIKIVEDEFEGRKYDKIVVNMVDGEEKFAITFRLESWFAVGFFQRIAQVKSGDTLEIGASAGKEGSKITFCWIKANGNVIKKDQSLKFEPQKTEYQGQIFHNYGDLTKYAKHFIEKQGYKPEEERLPWN